ncbi:MAG: hypothetical protein HYX90_10060 [Chloroflexi bacterium]|nr:hypothetical protein [Chloroflexota bacterium]
MSQAEKILKGIAATEDYKALAAAVDNRDYDSIGKGYCKVAELMADGKKQVVEKLGNLSRQNKDQERNNFESAFARRISSDLPHWYSISSLLREKGVLEGEVYSLGKKGDPLVRSPEGRLVVVSGSKAQPGSRIFFRIDTRGEKIDFGREARLDADLFYSLLNSDLLDSIRAKMDSIESRLQDLAANRGKTPAVEMSRLLTELGEVKEASERLRESERTRYTNRVQAIRRNIIGDWVTRSIFDFLNNLEEREISQACQNDSESIARALSAPGLFRKQSHELLRSRLFAGRDLKGYAEALAEREKALDTMNAALDLMEFKSGVDDAVPLAKRYFERMDVLFGNLHRRAVRLARSISENGVCSAVEIDASIEQEFSWQALGFEIRAAFRNPGDFHGTREAVARLRAMLGETESALHESAIKPYLSSRTAIAFPRRGRDD